jgi:RNA polymerase sigma factor (sigma-70 family)
MGKETQVIVDSVLQAWGRIKSLTRASVNAPDDAADLFNDTLVALLERYSACGTVPNPRYARLTARSLFYSAKRKERVRKACERLRTVSDEDPSKRWNDRCLQRSRGSVLDCVASHYEERTLAAALDATSPKDREVIELYFSYEKKRREVAAALGLSNRGATSRLRRALRRVKLAIYSMVDISAPAQRD